MRMLPGSKHTNKSESGPKNEERKSKRKKIKKGKNK